MNYDKEIKISIASNRKSTNWITQNLKWSDFINKVSKPIRTNESIEEFLKLNKSKQDELKDVGGFVGGTLKEGRRKAENILDRYVVSLDADNIEAGKTNDVLKKISSLGCSYVVYSTRKHVGYKPRLRIIIPLDMPVSADKYEPLARKIASHIDMSIMDKSTFEASRLMYWPSCSIDSEYIFVYEDKPFASAEGILKLYKNWKDCNEWPKFNDETEIIKKEASKQKDPLEKENIIGAFCRVYNIEDVIAKYLPDVYEAGVAPDKYTYSQGSVANGATVYGDGKWLYSYHATDPASRTLCNSFDLVRIHKFKDLDAGAKEETPVNRLPSFQAMCELALADKNVAFEYERTKLQIAKRDFEYDTSLDKEDNITWRLEKLSKNSSTGLIEKSIANVVTILTNDINLKGNMIFDRFSNRFLITSKLPWDRQDMIYPRLWGDSDDAELRLYLERNYDKFKGKDIINDALLVLKNRNSINVVKQYFENLPQHDGIPRLDSLFIDYLGAEDNKYVRATTRKIFVAAVTRAITERPIKFDNMIILTGPQGIGKSTILNKLAGEWFTDNIVDFNSKDTLLILQNCLIAEVAELQSFKKADVNTLKMFLGQKTDKFRAPYERREEEHPRHCVFFGTTNDSEFLRDATGNRRYWPIECGTTKPKKNVFKDLDDEKEQIWAEAVKLFRNGEKLYLDNELEMEAKKQQKERLEQDPWENAIVEYLDMQIHEDWYDKGLDASGKLILRDRVSVSEILKDCLDIPIRQQDRQARSRVLSVLFKLDNWEYKKNIRFSKNKITSGFERIKKT